LEKLPYLDIHTHRRSHYEDAVAVESLSMDDLSQRITRGTFCSAGIHPWWTEDFTRAEILVLQDQLLQLVREKKLWAIGETGIDRAIPETLEFQTELFHWHRELADDFGIPLIIHNVRSGSDFLSIMKKNPPKTAWIFHDFRGNEQLVKDLLRLHPECYFSFGISIDNSPQIRELLPSIPLTNLFLETDAQKHLDIHEIYLRASEKIPVDLEFLKSQIWMNFKRIRNEQ
jgi:TatD DNase family protein